MTTVPFKEEFADDVENDRKCQSIRPAECVNKSCQKNGGTRHYNFHPKPKCFLHCWAYKHRYKVGDTLQLYTGLMQRKHCNPNKKPPKPLSKRGQPKRFTKSETENILLCPSKGPYSLCQLDGGCYFQGAKLLKETTCTESFPIKFEDLTEEIARLDGFKNKTVSWDCNKMLRQHFTELTALEHLQNFLIKTYDAKEGDVFQVVRW